ncbi:unnamed protein product [Rotaria magnacalcarata]|uniref:F-box domain-containing protein n=1 Tax=Rotaria magnacalcarata TaxID=392030 RepID=A0A816WGK1_9BILA|nr:unnamed protein product [Rotaria magnacalcarata]
MSVSSFAILPDDILYEIFLYLFPADVLQSFIILLSKRVSRVIRNEYLWRIHIGDSTRSLMMFNDQCHNVLKLIESRLVPLRVTLTNVIGGWSLISSSLRYHQTRLLQCLHLIDIKPHEFDKLLRDHFIKQLHTLLVDVTPSSPSICHQVEGSYLVKVCSRMSLLRICRLPFNHEDDNANQIENDLLRSHMPLSNLLNTNQPRILTIGVHTSRFLERFLLCIPLIENLSFGVRDRDIGENDVHDRIRLPATIDAHLLQYLSRLRINCLNNISFHRTIALLSSIFSQLCQLSLKLEANTLTFGSSIISGDTTQQLCIDRLKPMATYSLNLLSCQMSTNVTNLFPRANTLSLCGYKKINRLRDLGKSGYSIASLVPWSLLTHIEINHSDVITQHTLESLLRLAYNANTLEIFDDRGILFRTILHTGDNFGTLINQQIKSLDIYDASWALQNVQRFCILLSNQYPNLKTLSFTICDSYRHWNWKPSRIDDGKNKSTKRIVNLIYLLVSHLQQLI